MSKLLGKDTFIVMTFSPKYTFIFAFDIFRIYKKEHLMHAYVKLAFLSIAVTLNYA